MAIRSAEGVLAVVCFAVNGKPERESYSKSLTVAILDECGIMLENERYKLAKREMEEKRGRRSFVQTCCARYPTTCARPLRAYPAAHRCF